MSDLTDMQTIRTQIIARLKAITVSPKPSYTIDGVTYRWTEYQEMLLQALGADSIAEVIAMEEGPISDHTVAIP